MMSRVMYMFIACAVAAGCTADTREEESALIESSIQTQAQAGPATMLPEAVQVLNTNGWYCTGVLVSDRIAVTAGHCLRQGNTWIVWAQGAPVAPYAYARRVEAFPGDYDMDPTTRDVGVMVLDKPIRLASYAGLTPIGEQVDAGEEFDGVVVGRGTETRYGALVRSKVMTVRSASDFGYTTGLRTEYFSFGGDSGGPLFLVQNGTITHQLIGIERQPEPSRNHDYFTRVDSSLIALVSKYYYGLR